MHPEGHLMKGSGGHLVGPESIRLSLRNAPTNTLFLSSIFLFILFSWLFVLTLLFLSPFLQNCQEYLKYCSVQLRMRQGCEEMDCGETEHSSDVGVQWPAMARLVSA